MDNETLKKIQSLERMYKDLCEREMKCSKIQIEKSNALRTYMMDHGINSVNYTEKQADVRKHLFALLTDYKQIKEKTESIQNMKARVLKERAFLVMSL